MRRICLGLVLCTSVSSCAPLMRVVSTTGTIATECIRNMPAERATDKALSSEDADSQLDNLAAVFSWDTIACAVKRILNSLTAASQASGELGATSSETKARLEKDQPTVDRALQWLNKKRK